MRVVIHDKDTYEPITVVTIPNQFIREMEQGTRDYSLKLPIPRPVSPYVRDAAAIDWQEAQIDILRIRFEPICRGSRGERFMWLCTAEDGESALLLRSAFLPGQMKEVRAVEQQAYLHGVLEALA